MLFLLECMLLFSVFFFSQHLWSKTKPIPCAWISYFFFSFICLISLPIFLILIFVFFILFDALYRNEMSTKTKSTKWSHAFCVPHAIASPAENLNSMHKKNAFVRHETGISNDIICHSWFFALILEHSVDLPLFHFFVIHSNTNCSIRLSVHFSSSHTVQGLFLCECVLAFFYFFFLISTVHLSFLTHSSGKSHFLFDGITRCTKNPKGNWDKVDRS